MTGSLALADIRDRIRRPSFIVVLVTTLVLGYYAVPPRDARYTLFYVGSGYVGTYNSAYLGTVTALACGLWLSLIGFYLVTGGVARDRASGVGEVLAGTRMSNVAYTLGKALSNFALLAAVMAAVALMTVVMQLVRGESRSLDLAAAWTPFLFLALPPLALTAAAAVVFELVPALRSGFGNVVWFFGWLVVALASQIAAQNGTRSGTWFDLLGMAPASSSMGTRLQETVPGIDSPPTASLGLMFDQAVVGRFTWSGLPIDGTLLLTRGLWLVVAVAVAALPALWFARFDPSRGPALGAGRRKPKAADEITAPPLPQHRGPVLPRTPVVRGPATAQLIMGELRILLAQVPRWWIAGAVVLAIVGVAVPLHESVTMLLPLAWIWPLLLWSRLGTHQYEYGVDDLVAGTPTPRRRMLAEWLAGAVIAAATGVGPLIRMVLAGDAADLAAWSGGVLAIPALALALGALTRSSRAFQLVYLVGWYAMWNTGNGIDLLGSGATLIVLAAAAAGLLAATVLIRERREAFR